MKPDAMLFTLAAWLAASQTSSSEIATKQCPQLVILLKGPALCQQKNVLRCPSATAPWVIPRESSWAVGDSTGKLLSFKLKLSLSR